MIGKARPLVKMWLASQTTPSIVSVIFVKVSVSDLILWNPFEFRLDHHGPPGSTPMRTIRSGYKSGSILDPVEPAGGILSSDIVPRSLQDPTRDYLVTMNLVWVFRSSTDQISKMTPAF